MLPPLSPHFPQPEKSYPTRKYCFPVIPQKARRFILELKKFIKNGAGELLWNDLEVIFPYTIRILCPT
jgi:hypothetical protein